MKRLKLRYYRYLFIISSGIAFFFMNISSKAMHNANVAAGVYDEPEPKESGFGSFIKDVEGKNGK